MTPAAPGSRRNIRISLARVSYDIVADATTDTGVARITGTGEILETGADLGAPGGRGSPSPARST